MNRISNISNSLVLENQGLILLQKDKKNHKQLKLHSEYFTYEDLKDSRKKNNFKKKFQKGQTVLCIPANQLFIESFFISREGRSKLNEFIRVKFINQLHLSENELYHSHYLVQEYPGDDYLVICFAVKREIINDLYTMLVGNKIKIKYILPLPLLLYIYHYNKDKDKINNIYHDRNLNPLFSDVHINEDIEQVDLQYGHISDEDSHEENHYYKNQAIIYLDRYYNKFAFTVFHSEGVYMRSANIENLKCELIRTVDYLKEYFELEKFAIHSPEGELELADIVDNEGVQTFEESIQNIYHELKKTEIKSLNLLVQLPVKKKKKLNSYRFIIGLLITLIILCNMLTFNIYIQRKNDSLEYNQKQLQDMEPAFLKLQEIETEITLGDARGELFRGILEDKHSYLIFLYELSKQLPDDTKISHLSFEGDNLVLLDGYALSAAKVMESLQDSSIFSSLEFIGGIIIDQEGERFRIAGDLVYD